MERYLIGGSGIIFIRTGGKYMPKFIIHSPKICSSNKSSSGQASIEFVMTYGWALLALVIVMGIIVATGMFTPGSFIPEECNFGNNLPCTFALYNDGLDTKLTIRYFNAFPYKINISQSDIYVATSDGIPVRFTEYIGLGADGQLESGRNFTITGTLGSPVPSGISKKFMGNVTFYSCAPEISTERCSTIPHTLSGRIGGKVQ